MKLHVIQARWTEQPALPVIVHRSQPHPTPPRPHPDPHPPLHGSQKKLIYCNRHRRPLTALSVSVSVSLRRLPSPHRYPAPGLLAAVASEITYVTRLLVFEESCLPAIDQKDSESGGVRRGGEEKQEYLDFFSDWYVCYVCLYLHISIRCGAMEDFFLLRVIWPRQLK